MYSSFGSLGGQGSEGGFGFIDTAKPLSEGDQLRADLRAPRMLADPSLLLA